MKIASTRKSLLIVIFILLAIDVVILLFFVAKNQPDRADSRNQKHSSLSTILSEEVGFSTEQMAKYQELRKTQQADLKPLFANMRRVKEEFYSLLYQDNISDSVKNELADSISLSQKNLDLTMFEYFKDLRSICTPGQLPAFDSSIKKVVLKMTGRRNGKGRPDEGRKSTEDER